MTSAPTPEPPKPAAERALAAVPVVLTVMATVLAGLSSSEMTQSMYYRSLASQNQSKAGSQWAFFQAKRIRGTTVESGADLIRVLADPPPLDVARLRADIGKIQAAAHRAGPAQALADAANRLAKLIGRDSIHQSLRLVAGPTLPPIAEQHDDDERIQSVVKAIDERQTEVQTAGLVGEIPPRKIEHALELSEANAAAFDDACKPVTADLRTVERAIGEIAAELRTAQATPRDDQGTAAGLTSTAGVVKDMMAGVRAARQDFTARRYAKEAAFNQQSAQLYEVMVRRTGAESDRHRTRSRNFFYAMLCAQAGVTIAAFALARSRKSWFWAVAGTAGIIAVGFGAYVYLAL